MSISALLEPPRCCSFSPGDDLQAQCCPVAAGRGVSSSVQQQSLSLSWLGVVPGPAGAEGLGHGTVAGVSDLQSPRELVPLWEQHLPCGQCRQVPLLQNLQPP